MICVSERRLYYFLKYMCVSSEAEKVLKPGSTDNCKTPKGVLSHWANSPASDILFHSPDTCESASIALLLTVPVVFSSQQQNNLQL